MFCSLFVAQRLRGKRVKVGVAVLLELKLQNVTPPEEV